MATNSPAASQATNANAAAAPETSQGADLQPNSGMAPPDVIAQRRAEGLPNAFDDDDDSEELAAAAAAKKGGATPVADEEGDGALTGDQVDDEAASTVEGTAPEGEGDGGLPAELVEQCEFYNLDPKDFASPTALQRHVAALDKMFFDSGNSALRALGQGGATTTTGTGGTVAATTTAGGQQPQQPQPGGAAASKAPEAPKIDFAAIEKEFGPELAGSVKQLHEYHTAFAAHQQQAYETRIAALEQKLGTVVQRHEQQVEAETIREVDDFFDGLEGWDDVVGKGTAAQLLKTADGKARYQDRMKVLEARDILEAGYLARGRTPPTGKVLLAKALPIAFPEKAKEIARGEIRGQAKARQRQFTPRPSHGQAPPRSQKDKVLDNIGATLAKYGMPVDGDEGDDETLL